MSAEASYDVELNFLVSRQSRAAGSEFTREIAAADRAFSRRAKTRTSELTKSMASAAKVGRKLEHLAGADINNQAAAADKVFGRGAKKRKSELAKSLKDMKSLYSAPEVAGFGKKLGAMFGQVGQKIKGSFGRGLGSGAGGALDIFRGMGTGGAAEWASKAAGVVGKILAAGITAALAVGIVGGIGDNVRKEQVQGRIASTLQLFDFASDAGSGEQQFTQNLQTARAYQNELVKIADAAPGDVDQVTDLFQNLLPGMAAVTQEHGRIKGLVEKEVYLAGILGNRFALVGEQTSRILTGGAGAEQDTWRLLQKNVSEAGRELGHFPKKSQLFGEKLTQAFNKLDPEARLATFEKALEGLSKPIRDYFENSWEGITAQGTSALKELRRAFGQEQFAAVKRSVKSLTAEGGVLNMKSERFDRLRSMMVGVGQQVGFALETAILKAGEGLAYVADHWEDIVIKAQKAGVWLAEGAKTATALFAARAGGAMLAQGAGALIQSTASILSMGAAALIAAPAFIALGVVVGGAAVMFGGVVTYLVQNIDDFAGALAQVDLTDLFQAVSDLGGKFYALGDYLLGEPKDAQTGLSTVVGLATTAVQGVTTAFEWLMRATADVIEFFSEIPNTLKKYNPLAATSNYTELATTEAMIGMLYQQGDDPLNPSETLSKLLDRRAELMEDSGLIRSSGSEIADKIRAAADAFAAGKGDPSEIATQVAAMLTPMGPELPPGFVRRNQKPPPVNVTVKNYNSWNIRDADPNAIVAAFNKTTAKQVANPIRTAMQRRQGA